MSTKTSKPTVVFDFDGVIHNYRNGWKGPDIIDDEPVLGIRESLIDFKQAGYKIVVVSARCGYPGGKEAIIKWMDKYGLYVDDVVTEKPPAICYIDDRAICFDGHPETLLEKVKNFVPWNKITIY